MALILNIETSTKNCSVGISENGTSLVLCEMVTDGYQHAERLHQFIQWAFEGCDYELKDLDAVCVGKGPGSYTGLRIGVSAAKGLCFALEIPMLAVNSLDIIAHGVEDSFDYIIPMTDARRKEVYTSTFDENLNIVTPTEAKILDEQSFQEIADKKIIFAGDGAEKAKEIMNLPNAVYQPEILPSAKYMTTMATEKYQQKAFEDVAYFEPFYLKDFVSNNKLKK